MALAHRNTVPGEDGSNCTGLEAKLGKAYFDAIVRVQQLLASL